MRPRIAGLPPNQRKPDENSTRAALRRFLYENTALKIFSLALAIILWGYVAYHRRGDSTEFRFNTPVILKNIPQDMDVTGSQVESVAVLVRADRTVGASVNPNLFQVFIDLGNQLSGPFTHTLTRKNITYNNATLPTGLTVLQISPVEVPITLEEAVVKEVKIRPRFYGDMAEGYTLHRIEMLPDKVKIKGAKSRLENVNTVFTRPLDVEDLKTNVEMLANLDLPQGIRLSSGQDDFFQARLTVTQAVSRLLLRNIPVVVEHAKFVYKISTKQVNAYIEGPEEIMKVLDRETVAAVFDMVRYPPGDYRGQTPHINLPDAVRVLEQWPIIDLFVINRPLK